MRWSRSGRRIDDRNPPLSPIDRMWKNGVGDAEVHRGLCGPWFLAGELGKSRPADVDVQAPPVR